MEVRGRFVALYGRFTPGGRERLATEVVRRGGKVARDLTRRSDVFVVGALALPLIEGGHLAQRIAGARARKVPVFSERRFAALLEASAQDACTLPLAAIEAQTGLSDADIEVLAAFDIVRIEDGHCRFADAAALKSAAEIIAAGRSMADAVRILAEARDIAPKGRHRIVVGETGPAALQWETGRTTLAGQGFLPLDEKAASIEDLFEAAALAEVEGDLEEAARLYDMSARADRKDPIAPFNLGNVRLEQKAHDQAIMAYRQAIARDPEFAEAHYNLALAYEARGKTDAARAELRRALTLEPTHADAVFNLAQLELKRGDIAAAKALFETYLQAEPPEDWAAKARKAILYCTARLSA